MECRPDNFSYPGLLALWEYFEEYEDSTGEEIELDVIAICCEYSEYKDLKEFQAAYGEEYETREDIEEQMTFIPIDDNSFIIQQF
jgi:hypothetical protein